MTDSESSCIPSDTGVDDMAKCFHTSTWRRSVYHEESQDITTSHNIKNICTKKPITFYEPPSSPVHQAMERGSTARKELNRQSTGYDV
jgi:hypothetical protein